MRRAATEGRQRWMRGALSVCAERKREDWSEERDRAKSFFMEMSVVAGPPQTPSLLPPHLDDIVAHVVKPVDRVPCKQNNHGVKCIGFST